MPQPSPDYANANSDYRKAGLALIVGTLAGVLVMAAHPTAHDLFQSGKFDLVARLNTAVHGMALLSSVVVFLGALGLTRRFNARDRLALAALVFFGFGTMAVVIAGSMSGFIAVDAGRRFAAAASDALRDDWRVALQLSGFLNQAFARVYVVAASLAILLWSLAILKQPALRAIWRRIAIYGCVVAPLIAIAVSGGWVPLNVHGFGMIVVLHGLWFIFVGLELRSAQEQSAIQPS